MFINLVMMRQEDGEDAERLCGEKWPNGKACGKPAGWGTNRVGYGPCVWHSRDWRVKRAWEMAMSMAEELDVSPWESLLLGVTKSWNRVVWVDTQLHEAIRVNDGDMSAPAVGRWLSVSRKERALAARIAQAAIHAGVAERLTRQVELESAILLRVITRTLDALGLNEDQRLTALTTLHRELLEIEGPADLPLEGQQPLGPEPRL